MPPSLFTRCCIGILIILLTTLVGADYYWGAKTIFYFEDIYYIMISLSLFLVIVATTFFTGKNVLLKGSFSRMDLLLLLLAAYITYRSPLYFNINHALLNTTLLEFYCAFALFYVIRHCLIKYQLKDLIVIAIGIITLFEAILSILQFYGILRYPNNNFKLGGTFNNPSILGNFFALTIPFLLGIVLFSSHNIITRVQKSFIYLIAGLAAYATIISMSRSSWIGLTISLLALLIIRYRSVIVHWKNRSPKLFAGMLIVLAIFGSAMMLILFSLKRDSSLGRHFIYKRCFELIAANPFIGYGQGSFGRTYNLFQSAYFANHTATPQEKLVADNINIAPGDFIQIWIELGSIGLVLILIIFLVVISSGISQLKNLNEKDQCFQAGSLGALIAVVVCGLLSYPLHIIPISIPLLIILSMLHTAGNTLFTFSLSDSVKKISLLIAMGILFLLFFIQIQQYRTQREWRKLNIASGFLNDESTAENYYRLYKSLGDKYLFLSEMGVKLFQLGRYSAAIQLLEESNHYLANYQTFVYIGIAHQELNEDDKALENFKMAVNMVPNRLLPKFHLLKCYLKMDNQAAAKMLANEILAMPVKVRNPTTDFIKEEVTRMMSATPFPNAR